MKIEKFEDILAWQKAKELVVEICNNYSNNNDYGFRDQIQCATVSIMNNNNIAEGFERSGDKEFKKFLYIAKGSSAEVRSMLYLSLELGHIDKNQFESLYGSIVEISKLISGFIKSLNNNF